MSPQGVAPEFNLAWRVGVLARIVGRELRKRWRRYWRVRHFAKVKARAERIERVAAQYGGSLSISYAANKTDGFMREKPQYISGAMLRAEQYFRYAKKLGYDHNAPCPDMTKYPRSFPWASSATVGAVPSYAQIVQMLGVPPAPLDSPPHTERK